MTTNLKINKNYYQTLLKYKAVALSLHFYPLYIFKKTLQQEIYTKRESFIQHLLFSEKQFIDQEKNIDISQFEFDQLIKLKAFSLSLFYYPIEVFKPEEQPAISQKRELFINQLIGNKKL